MKFKKELIGIAAVALVALMISNVYAQLPTVRKPLCLPDIPGLTPGFWKHNIEVRLDLTNGAYSALPDGTKLDDGMMDGWLAEIQVYLPWFTFPLALQYLELPGWSTDRTNTADWFNWAAGLGYF